MKYVRAAADFDNVVRPIVEILLANDINAYVGELAGSRQDSKWQ
jgi:hypothetical protein